MSPNRYAFGPFLLDPMQRRLQRGEQSLGIGSRAFDVLLVLVEQAGSTVLNKDLLARVWKGGVVDIGSLRVHVATLRKILGDGQDGQRYIANIPLQGYCFVAPVEVLSAPAAIPPPEAPPAPLPAQHLPSLLTRLLGRDALIQELQQRLPERRCISLVGAGGIGKTSVAIAAASAAAASYRQQIVFVELAALSEGRQLPMALASALGIGMLAADPLRGLAAYLRDRRLLIVLDNCEHLIDAVAELVEALLRQAPGVDVLATSREPLRIQGEWVQRLASLEVPPGAVSTLQQALQYPAVQLFVERVSASGEDLLLEDRQAALLGEICRRLDGIPLAIELAAASVERLGLRGLAEHLEDRLATLRRGRRTALPRHQTLRATLDWSHDLLCEAERAVLRRLAVFRSYFDLEAAVALGRPLDGSALDVADIVSTLLEKSLITTDIARGGVEYRLLEVTREYALERLAAAGELAPLRQRHAQLQLARLEQTQVEQASGPPADWLALHGRRIDDVRAALAWADADDERHASGLALLAASAPLWFALSLMAEFRALAERALAAPATLDPVHEMKICEAHGHALWHTRGSGPAMAAAFGRAQAIAETLQATPYQLRALWGLWLICNSSGDYAGSAALALHFGEIVAATGQAEAELTHQRMMALGLHYQGQQARARAHAEHVLAHPVTVNHTARNSGFQFDQRVAALTVLARILWIHGRPDAALQHAHRAIQEALAIDHALSLCYALANGAAPVAFWAGDDAAAESFTELLLARSTEHSLVFWQAFGEGYQLLLKRRNGSAPATGLETLLNPSTSPLLLETLCTVEAALIDERLLARADSRQGGWCAAELLRAKGEHLLARGARDEAEALFRESLQLARQQQAWSWALRSATSLAALCGDAPALQLLDEALQAIEAGQATPDVRAAQAQRDRLAHHRPAAS